jgi:putative transposase
LPWEIGYDESLNAKLQNELLDGEVFYSLQETQTLIEAWRRHCNAVRPHSALRWTPPAREVLAPIAKRVWPPSPLASRSANN